MLNETVTTEGLLRQLNDDIAHQQELRNELDQYRKLIAMLNLKVKSDDGSPTVIKITATAKRTGREDWCDEIASIEVDAQSMSCNVSGYFVAVLMQRAEELKNQISAIDAKYRKLMGDFRSHDMESEEEE